MPLWALIALAAGTLQTGRNALARSLAFQISPALNTWARFAFNLPFSALLILVLRAWVGPVEYSVRFFAYNLATAVAQLLGNVALIAAFRRATFAQSIVLHKLEVAFAALIGALFFSEYPALVGWIGVAACTVGVLFINLGRDHGPAGWRRAFHLDRGAALAIASGLLWVFASFFLKDANAAFVLVNPRVGTDRFEAAAYTLFHTTWLEVAILSVWLWLAEPGALRSWSHHLRRMSLLGATSFGGSLCWYWAYSLTLVAYVKAVGQVEAVIAVVLSLTVWHEREVLRQIPGVVLVLIGIALVLVG